MVQLKPASMRNDEWTGTDSLRPFGARVKCSTSDLTVEYKIHKFKFQTESVAVAFAIELCAYPFEEEAARNAIGIYNGSIA